MSEFYPPIYPEFFLCVLFGIMPPKPSSSWTTKVLNHAKTTFELFVRFVGPLFVILATILISAVIVVHFRAIIPYYTDYDTLSGLIHLTVSSFISYNIGFNYFKTIFTPPGSTFEVLSAIFFFTYNFEYSTVS